jgi:hypothetical protein
MKTYKAKDIIPLYITFLKTIPKGQKQWDKESLHNIPGAIILIEKISALLHAFSIKSDITVLKSGDFYPHLPFFRRKMYPIKLMTNQYTRSELERFYKPEEAIYKYDSFLLWESMNSILTILPETPPIKDSFREEYFSGKLYYDIKSKIPFTNEDKIKKRIYKILGAYLDPWDRSITKEKLICKYNYPVQKE